jgi:hypothetical protein
VFVAPLIPMAGAFSTTNVFYARDLAALHWPWHLYMRRMWLQGDLPLWDPNHGLGYPFLADPNTQPLMPITLALRLLFPAVLGFNLWIALAPSVGTLGAYLFIRRSQTTSAAACGALAFGLSGPVASMGNLPNMAWSVALVGWVLFAADRLVDTPDLRRAALLAVVIALQALSGEPVTLVATAALALLWAGAGAEWPRNRRERLRAIGLVLACGLAGALLAAVQLLPLADLTSRSLRGAGAEPDRWWIHPLALLETVAPGIFGSNYASIETASPWLGPLNTDREAFLASLYVGVPTLTLAAIGAASAGVALRVRLFWSLTLLAGVCLAVGPHLPLYDLMRNFIPVTRSFRYPAKYGLFAALAVAPLAACGWRTMINGPGGRRERLIAVAVPAAFAVLGALLLGSCWWFQQPGGSLVAAAAAALSADADKCVEFWRQTAPGSALHLLAVATGCILALGLALLGRRGMGAALFLVVLTADLMTAAVGLNPTMAAARLAPPPWLAEIPQGARLYVPKRSQLEIGERDLPTSVYFPPGVPGPAVVAVYTSTFVGVPAAYGISEPLAVDVSRLRAREYTALLDISKEVNRDARYRLLRRLGVRYFIANGPPFGDARYLAPAGLEPFSLWADPATAARCFVTSDFVVRSEPSMAPWFEDAFDPTARVELDAEPPPPAGAPNDAAFVPCAITMDRGEEVEILASGGTAGGFVVILDAWDPNWSALVDGVPAPVLRASGLFRAVRIAAGVHRVEFQYRPRPFAAGVILSLATGVALAIACVVANRRSRGRTSDGVAPDSGAATEGADA